MKNMIKKTHHSALRPTRESYEKTVKFYTEILGMTAKEWYWDHLGNQVPCAMVDAGDGVCIEIFGNGSSDEVRVGTYPHMCYEVENVDETMTYLKENGYPSTNSMGVMSEELYTDFVMSKDLNMVWRCGFIVGPCGEIIEFLQDISK